MVPAMPVQDNMAWLYGRRGLLRVAVSVLSF